MAIQEVYTTDDEATRVSKWNGNYAYLASLLLSLSLDITSDTFGAVAGTKDSGGTELSSGALITRATANRAALQAAVDVLPASGGTVFIPAGVFYVNTNSTTGRVVTLPTGKPVTIAGVSESSSSLKLISSNGNYAAIIGAASTTDASGLVVRDLTIDQNDTGNAITSVSTAFTSGNVRALVDVSIGTNIHIERCHFTNMNGLYGVRLAHPATLADNSDAALALAHVWVTDNQFDGIGGASPQEESVDWDFAAILVDGREVHITGNTLRGRTPGSATARTAIQVSARDGVVSNNQIENFLNGIVVYGGTTTGSGTIVPTATSNLEVVDNSLETVVRGIRLLSYYPGAEPSDLAPMLKSILIARNTILLDRPAWQPYYDYLITAGVSSTNALAQTRPEGIKVDPQAVQKDRYLAPMDEIEITQNVITFERPVGVYSYYNSSADRQACGISIIPSILATKVTAAAISGATKLYVASTYQVGASQAVTVQYWNGSAIATTTMTTHATTPTGTDGGGAFLTFTAGLPGAASVGYTVGKDGTTIEYTDLTISSNTITDSFGPGIRLAATLTGAVVEDNTVINPGQSTALATAWRCGLEVDADLTTVHIGRNSFVDVQATPTMSYGLYIAPIETLDVEITRNRVRSTGETAVACQLANSNCTGILVNQTTNQASFTVPTRSIRAGSVFTDVAGGRVYTWTAAGTSSSIYTPGKAASTTQRGVVKKAATQANSSASTVAGAKADLNSLLAKLRTAGILAP